MSKWQKMSEFKKKWKEEVKGRMEAGKKKEEEGIFLKLKTNQTSLVNIK